MTEQDFIPGADIFLNPKRQMEAKEKEELIKLRDQFAMAAIQGAALLMYDRKMVMAEHARNAYVIADEMLEARRCS